MLSEFMYMNSENAMHEFRQHEFIVSYSYTNSYYMNSKCHIHI
jgi:hypothetical protein